MIKIRKSETADSRTCDYKSVSKDQLYSSSIQHIGDVKLAIDFFAQLLKSAANNHDHDKLSNIDQFHEDFLTGFEQEIWWHEHLVLNRHHLMSPEGIPNDVNLIDVLEMIADCVMAGMARKGEVYPLTINEDLLMLAFDNTVNLLRAQVVVEE